MTNAVLLRQLRARLGARWGRAGGPRSLQTASPRAPGAGEKLWRWGRLCSNPQSGQACEN